MKAGATLITRATVDDLVIRDGRIAEVTILDRTGGLTAPVVVAADGVLSFTAKKAGLRQPTFGSAQMAVGVKALIDMPRGVINDRFGLGVQKSGGLFGGGEGSGSKCVLPHRPPCLRRRPNLGGSGFQPQ